MPLLDEALERLRALSPSDQESAAAIFLAILERYEEPSALTPEQVERARQLEAQLLAGELDLLSEEETAAMWRRLGA
ncbi:hypothetical protein [Enterovirga sp.]|uniref:hypothetical protein n=1 Tax=Enterovirga sp. TaxID=2026350 RepID=UPI002C2DCF8E|nr:hypothetical protein [Enterovirga sp.]HMO30839.1 hypothetical protein [Enterovirga sp.]